MKDERLPKPEIFRYTEYRTFLKDVYLYQKEGNPAFSHRYLAARIGFDSGHFSKILAGKRNLTPPMILKFADLFKLNRKEKEYFELLVLATHAKLPRERMDLLARLRPLRPKLSKTIVSGLDEYYRNWFHSALRELLGFYPFRGDLGSLGKMIIPALTVDQARQGVELLTLIGFIKKDAQGGYRVVDPHITTGYRSPSEAVRQYIRATLDLGKDALERIPRESRNISSMTFSTTENHFLQLQEKIRLFRKELADEVDKVERPDRVYHLNIQLFPVSKAWSPDK